MYKIKISLVIVGLLLSMLFITACGSSPTGNESTDGNGSGTEETITLRLGHVTQEDNSYAIAANGFAKDVEAATNGRVKIEVFGAGQLGGELQMVESVQLGSLDMFAGSSAALSNFIPELGVFDLPFLFKDYEHVYRALDGEFGETLNDKISDVGFKNLGFWEFGFKSIANTKKEVRSVEDMKSMKIRTIENPVVIDTYRALGADPTPIPFTEVYTSLQSGIVNASDGSYTSIFDGRFHELQNHISEVNISYGAAQIVINKELFESFDEETQKVFIDIGKKYSKEQPRINQENSKQVEEIIKDTGVKVVELEDIDIQSFRDAVQPVYEKNSQFADLVEKIQDAQ